MWQLFTSGFFLTSSNPKDLLFFIGFLPAFVDVEQPRIDVFLIAAIVIVITFFATLSFYACSAAMMRKVFSDADNLTRLNKISGVVIICAGLYVMFT